MRRRAASSARPNPAHFALAKLENALQERLFTCTQNVDSLHEQAGSRKVVHMHGELFKSRCDTCSRPPFDDTNLYEPPADVRGCECGGQIRPHICWFGEVPFELDRIYRALDRCTLFMAIGTSGEVHPAAGFVAQVKDRARTIYVGPEKPANASSFTECYLGKAEDIANRPLKAAGSLAPANRHRGAVIEDREASSSLDVFQLFLIQPEIVAQFMDDRQADLFADLGLAGADRFNILLIKHDVIGPRRQVKYALPGRGHAMEDTQKQLPVLSRPR